MLRAHSVDSSEESQRTKGQRGMKKAVKLMMNMQQFDKLSTNPVFKLLNSGHDLKGMVRHCPPPPLPLASFPPTLLAPLPPDWPLSSQGRTLYNVTFTVHQAQPALSLYNLCIAHGNADSPFA